MMKILIALVVIIVLWSLWSFWGSRVEQADYKVLKKMNGYEIREYPAHIIAQTKIQGYDRTAMRDGFRILAGYIFGGNIKAEKIAMTTPVVMQNDMKNAASENIVMTAPVMAATEGESRVMSFGMPRSYTFESLPTPNDARVQIVTIPAKKYAVMRFSWYRSEKKIRSMQETVLTALDRHGVVARGNMAYAGYRI